MKIAAITDIGSCRQENQDNYCAQQLAGGTAWGIVCDGMGGAEGGQIASSVAVETFMKEMHALIRADMTAEQLRELASFCVAKANTAVYQRALQDPAYQGMGTTLVSAVAEEKYAIVCNIGDSRAYLIRGGEITRITHDHSVVQTLVENGNITAEEARTHPNRNLITRALGPDENTLCDAFEVSFTKGDKILLCTDGLVVTATDDEICRAVCAGKSAEESLDDLIALAKAQGAQLGEREIINDTRHAAHALERVVVEHDELVVRRQVHVHLDGVARLGRSTEGRERIFRHGAVLGVQAAVRIVAV